MNHGEKGRKFSRETKQRKALMRALAVALIDRGRIETTEAKAKSLRTYLEKLITTGKAGNLTAAKLFASRLGQTAARKLKDELVPKAKGRGGGYTRIRKLPPRTSDGAKMALIELIN